MRSFFWPVTIVTDSRALRHRRARPVRGRRRGRYSSSCLRPGRGRRNSLSGKSWRRSTASTARTEERSSLAAYPGSGSTVSARDSRVTQLTANSDAAHRLRSLDSAIPSTGGRFCDVVLLTPINQLPPRAHSVGGALFLLSEAIESTWRKIRCA